MENNLLLHTKSCTAKAGRRFLALLLACAMMLSLAACGGQKTGGSEDIKPVTVEREPEPQTLQTAGEATAIALRQYIYARLATEAFAAADFPSLSIEEVKGLADEAALAWESAALLTSAAEDITIQALLLLEAPSLKETSAAVQPQAQLMTLATVPADISLIPLAAGGGKEFDPKTWAENLTKQYDAIKGAQRYQQLARQLGIDAKDAYQQMTLAQEIIHNQATADAAFWDKMTKAAQATKTASKVVMLGWSMAATGGASVGLLEGAGLLVGGVDCIVDVAETGSTLILGEKSQAAVAFGDIKETLGPVSALVGLVTLNPSDVGKVAKDTTEALVYISDSLVDLFYEDKIMGIKVEGVSKEAVRISGQMLETGSKAALEAAGFLYPETTKAVSELVGLWEPAPEVMIARMDALTSQMAELAQAAGIAAEEEPDPDSAEGAPPQAAVGALNIFGKYTCVMAYDGGETETQTISIQDQGDGSVVWTDYEGDETILFYDKSSHTLYLEDSGFTIHIVFSDSGGKVTGSGYESGILWGEPLYVDFALTKTSD